MLSRIRPQRLIRQSPSRLIISKHNVGPQILPIRGMSSSANPQDPKLLRNGLLALGALGAAAISHFYPEYVGLGSKEETNEKGEIKRPTFVTRTKTRNGVVSHEHERLSDQEAEEKMTRHANTRTFRPSKATSVVRYDNNWVECNDPIEDRHAEDFIDRALLFSGDQGKTETTGIPGIKLFSILDGHSGWECAQLLSQTLHPMILLSLRSLYAGHEPPSNFSVSTNPVDYIRNYIQSLQPKIQHKVADTFPFLAVPAKINPQTITNSLISAFLTLDEQIVKSPLRLIPHVPNKPGQPNVRPIIAPMLAPAVSGACAINLLVDEDRDEIYVSNTGDCRAVAGYWVEGEKGQPSGWRCEVLSEDMMGDNENEVKRLQREHPGENPIRSGRVLGRLQPTRTFGDSPLYKWTADELEKLREIAPSVVPDRNMAGAPSQPYVTAKPEVAYKKLTRGDKEGDLRFIVMATDGLWDAISSEESVALVASYLSKPPSKSFPRDQVTSKLLPQKPESAARYPPSNNLKTGDWVYQDTNAATHLIRNALSTGQVSAYELLSMKAPIARWRRDDITCTVVFFGDQPGLERA